MDQTRDNSIDLQILPMQKLSQQAKIKIRETIANEISGNNRGHRYESPQEQGQNLQRVGYLMMEYIGGHIRQRIAFVQELQRRDQEQPEKPASEERPSSASLGRMRGEGRFRPSSQHQESLREPQLRDISEIPVKEFEWEQDSIPDFEQPPAKPKTIRKITREDLQKALHNREHKTENEEVRRNNRKRRAVSKFIPQ